MNEFDFYAVQVSGTKTQLKKAGIAVTAIRTERVGFKHYGRKSYPVYRTYASVNHFPSTINRDELAKCESDWTSKGLKVSTKYFARD